MAIPAGHLTPPPWRNKVAACCHLKLCNITQVLIWPLKEFTNYSSEKPRNKAHAGNDPDFTWALPKVNSPSLLLVVCSSDSCCNTCCHKKLNDSVFSFQSLIQTLTFVTEEQTTAKKKTETSAVWNLVLPYDADSSILKYGCFLFPH